MGYASFNHGPYSEAPPPGQQVRGINPASGEGGFWAKIVFQDKSYPKRYAFVQQHRMYDPNINPADVKFHDANGSNPYGEQSLWNDPTTGGNFTQAWRADTGTANIPAGRVLNWATEANGNVGVPLGSYVWMRPGETYNETEFGTNKDDWTFTYSAVNLLFGTTKTSVANSDTQFQVDHITIAQIGGSPTMVNTDIIIVYNWCQWAANISTKVMFCLLDLTPDYPAIGHGNFVQGPCPP